MKKTRQEKIIELINAKCIDTQEELLKELVSLGFKATQATVSRDIKELRIVKALDLNGVYRYTVNNTSRAHNEVKFTEIFANSVISAENAMNDVVIKCHSGMAQGACAALDSLFSEYTIGTLAGDDTIFAITHNAAEAKTLVEKIRKML